MNAQQTLDYIHSFATHFRLHEHIQLRTRVHRIVRAPNDKQWQLSVSRHGREERVLAFDKVVLCTGNTHVAKVPRIEGSEAFRGEMLHSQNFKR